MFSLTQPVRAKPEMSPRIESFVEIAMGRDIGTGNDFFKTFSSHDETF
jgi:hypothetical protein